MNEKYLFIALAFAAGAVLAALYFGTLWLTVRAVAKTGRPGVLLFASFLVRISLLLCAFYFVMGGSWQRIAACMLGFLIVRGLVLMRAKMPVPRPEKGE